MAEEVSLNRADADHALRGRLSYSFALVEVTALLPHEETEPCRLKQLISDIARRGALVCPIMVDRHSLVVLDGHHRLEALCRLGCSLVPSYLVDYSHPAIAVAPRRADTPVSKESVVQAGLGGRRYPPKITCHTWGLAPPERPFPLSALGKR